MSEDAAVVIELARGEAAHLAALVEQFVRLLSESPPADPALQRLSPPVYPDDAEASAEFRALTADDLHDRRRADAQLLLTSLGELAEPTATDHEPAQHPLPLDRLTAQAWLRTLAGVRLVLATRLGVADDDAHDDDDPRFAVYDWLGYRLDNLVGALEGR
ncbi:DUF2017 domain-containing protein [Microbacterium fluvii]|uniref:DUF2017 domain-containing protein n=1 Tax=Microbacterium fluvii TaxID=415215 RepID=A0ABW2HCQ3_9MICO|nr:DUF2017 domain-containing protein [Microbacterium fluvii]MCU4672531.1 DUF2017 domain-containing protein [Microbacterium fluvii]